MNRFLKKNISVISFILIPIFFLWDPNWLGILGIQPYWPLFWLLPWSMVYGPINGLMVGLILGLVLDSISISSSFTQIPGLMICGFWFGKFNICRNVLVGHFRHGLICSIGSFICSILYFLQILLKNYSEDNFLFFYSGFQNILVQVFLTGLFAPLICSRFLRIFQKSKDNVWIK